MSTEITPQQFVDKWAATSLGERQSYQLHFVDLCRLIGHETPKGDGLDSTGRQFMFERSLKKESGGQGFADVYLEDHFAIEYKAAGKYKNLKEAYHQLQQYREKLKNPPLLVVTDIDNWEIHTNFPNTEKKTYAFKHEEIATRPTVRQWLHHLFEAPERLHPRRNTEQVTADAARVFQLIADNMRNWEAAPDRIAHFLTKLVFCLFAEDVSLLPAGPKGESGIFSEIVERTRTEPERFMRYMHELFQAMADGGEVMFADIPYFNGALFDDVRVEELSLEALTELETAARLNWESIEPSIFGTLFERSLDPNKRSQLGAHYTSREDILLIVEPVLMQPLRREWEAIQQEAQPIRERYDAAENRRAITTNANKLIALRERMLKRLREITVLDPACGSGNFLYVSLQLLMDMEKEVLHHDLFSGLPLVFPEVHPRQMFGIELNPIAHALASIVVWIGYIQWKIQNGYPDNREPILEYLGENIVCKDAILPPSVPPLHGGKTPVSGDQNLEDTVSRYENRDINSTDAPLSENRRGAGEEAKYAHTRRSAELWQVIKPLAREMRKNPTPAEDALWQRLRKKQLMGVKFRRQHPIDRFIVDFFAAGHKLVIEVDGSIHETQQEADALRQEYIESLGIRVLRFTNAEVLQQMDAVLEVIGEQLLPPSVPPTLWGEAKEEVKRWGEEIEAAEHRAEEASAKSLPEDLDASTRLTPLPENRGGAGGGVEWPPVDVIVGNPPFLGGSKIRGELGDEYYETLTAFYEGSVPGFADLVCYWFEQARAHIEKGKAQRAGLLATNSIRGGANREVLKRIKETGDIFMAWSDREWVLDGAAVRVSMVGFDSGDETTITLDGLPAATINPDLSASANITKSKQLEANARICLRADEKGGPFDIPDSLAQEMLSSINSSGRSNTEVLYPYRNGLDITRRPRGVWIIDFGVNTSRDEASLYKLPFSHVEANVKPMRANNNIERLRKNWWLHRIPGADMRAAISNIPRYIATPSVAKHRLFVWLDHNVLPDHQLYVFARDDDYFFGILHSRLHEVWSLRMGTWLGKGNDPRYTPTTTFETFPFPWSPGQEESEHPAYQAIAAAAKQLHEERDAWLNPFPPQSPHSDRGMQRLKDRTLTNLYNALNVFRGKEAIKIKPAAGDFAPRLDELHTALDHAVCDAYGWAYDILDDEEAILTRLLALNLERAEAQ